MNTRKQMNLSGNGEAGAGPLEKSMQVCRHMAAKCGELRDRLMQRIAIELRGGVSEPLVRRAVIEAEALANTTPFPLLFLPALAEEKVRSVRQWTGRQREILERQRTWATVG